MFGSYKQVAKQWEGNYLHDHKAVILEKLQGAQRLVRKTSWVPMVAKLYKSPKDKS